MRRTLLICTLCSFSVWGASQTPASCPLEGDAKTPALQQLNQLKNRFSPPGPNQFNPSITLTAMLAPGDDTHRWSPAMAAQITGFVVDVRPGGSETVNCHATDAQHTDTHIEIAVDSSDTAPARLVIAEITPRGRAIMAGKQPPVDWSTAHLRQTLKGKRVVVRGWMMFDAQHWNVAENTAPGHSGNWRATAWEIHPVTGIQPSVTLAPQRSEKRAYRCIRDEIKQL
jgi:hypothetical protein